MKQFLAIAQEEHCLLLEGRTGAVIEPDEDIVRERLAASLAGQFVRDPTSTTIQAARELRDDSDAVA
jgi:hypothetical protein